MKRVAILGATGYSALEVIRLLLKHPEAEIVAATSRQEDSPALAAVHPSLTGRTELRCENLSPADVAERADCAFGCLPHGVTAQSGPALLEGGCRFIDLSADYRLKDPAVYQQWYGLEHEDREHLPQAVYGLPELFREEIRDARLIANPGCYPTTASLALAPLLKAGLIQSQGIIIDAKSGVSGAGRTPKVTSLYCEVNESVSAYNVGKHRHTPEIEQNLRLYSGQEAEVIFTPHLVPMDRGILATTYSTPVGEVSQSQVMDVLRETYHSEPFVKVVEHLPSTKETTGTNRCHITARVVQGKVMTISVLDNLIKGAAGAAVQNFNLVFGFNETTALL